MGTALLERRLPVERQLLTALRAAVARLREISATLPTAGPPPDGLDVSGQARRGESPGAQRA
jgi:hypothetical protein